MATDDNHQTPPKFTGKPLAYLDHNIIDAIEKYKIPEFQKWIKDSYTPVYSNESLEEIKRSSNENTFLEILEQLEAIHIHPTINQQFIPIENQATLTARCPFEIYDRYIDSMKPYSKLITSALDLNRKFMGGKKDRKFSDITDEQKKIFQSFIQDSIASTENINHPLITETVNKFKIYAETHPVIMDKTSQLLESSFKNQESWNGLKEFRNSNNMGPKELNNIKEKNVVEKIKKILSENTGKNETLFDIDFYEKAMNRAIPTIEQCSIIYNILNTIGYFPDSSMHKDNRFNASTSDCTHVSFASLCSFLISCDDKLIKKASATYEYLKVSTKTIKVNIKPNS
jgi:hypothetical protein